MPPTRSKPFFDLLDSTLSDELTRQVGRPFWIDTVGRSNFVDIRVKLDDAVMHVIARRSQTYASNWQIFLLWMVGTSLVLLTVAILFLRNQIKPILRLAEAADAGLGDDDRETLANRFPEIQWCVPDPRTGGVGVRMRSERDPCGFTYNANAGSPPYLRAPGGRRSDIETVSRSLRTNNRNFHRDGRGSKGRECLVVPPGDFNCR